MRLYFGLLAFWIALVFGQGGQECTAEMVRTDDCAAVINPAACYNQFRFNANTLRCIEGTDNADRARKVRGPGIHFLSPTVCREWW